MKIFKRCHTLHTPYSQWFPSHAQLCNRKEIDDEHLKCCNILNIPDVYTNLEWKFETKFRCTEGQAEWDEEQYPGKWFIRYSTKCWIPMGLAGRKNTIVHEICHLAVEKLYGHGNIVDNRRVTTHGTHWEQLMRKCGEDPLFTW